MLILHSPKLREFLSEITTILNHVSPVTSKYEQNWILKTYIHIYTIIYIHEWLTNGISMEHEPLKSSRYMPVYMGYSLVNDHRLSTTIFSAEGSLNITSWMPLPSGPREEEICWLVWPKAAWGNGNHGPSRWIGVHGHGGYPFLAGWFLETGTSDIQMDDDWGYPDSRIINSKPAWSESSRFFGKHHSIPIIYRWYTM